MPIDLETLLSNALAKQRREHPTRQRKDRTHEDYAKRLAEKAIYRRLARDAHIQLDGSRFQFYFDNLDGMSLDQWRHRIDKQMAAAGLRREKLSRPLEEDE